MTNKCRGCVDLEHDMCDIKMRRDIGENHICPCFDCPVKVMCRDGCKEWKDMNGMTQHANRLEGRI